MKIESVAILLAADLDTSTNNGFEKFKDLSLVEKKGQVQAKLQHVKMKSLKSALKDT